MACVRTRPMTDHFAIWLAGAQTRIAEAIRGGNPEAVIAARQAYEELRADVERLAREEGAK